jgi:hypothetical protein
MTARFPRLRRFFPIPLVAVAALLAILILITPNLTTPAGSLATQAELLVDGVTGSNQTHVYVRGLGTVRFARISLGVGTFAHWNAIPPISNLTFTSVVNTTDSLGVSYVTTRSPVALNVTVIYRDSTGSCVSYTGVYAVEQSPPDLLSIDLSAGSGVVSTPITELPLILLLNSAPIGAC